MRDFKEKVLNALKQLITTEEFFTVAYDNYKSNAGREEELYPYFNEFLRREFEDDIIGIGSGLYPRQKKKADCLCILKEPKKIYAIEIKGPSKDLAWLRSGGKKDFEKLEQLQKSGIINQGLVVIIYIVACGHINSSHPQIDIDVLETASID